MLIDHLDTLEQAMILLIWIGGLFALFLIAGLFFEIWKFARDWRKNTPASWRRPVASKRRFAP